MQYRLETTLQPENDVKQLKPSFANMNELYRSVLLQWISYQQRNKSINKHNSRGQQSFYHRIFKPKLVKQTKVNVLLDKRIVFVMESILSQLPYFRINKEKNQATGQKVQQDADRIISIAQELAYQNFITKGILDSIKEKASLQQSVQAKLEKIIDEIGMKKIPQNRKQDLIQVWQRHFPRYTFETIWTRVILPNRQKLSIKLVEAIYSIYKTYIKDHPNIKFSLTLAKQFEGDQIQLSRILHFCILNDIVDTSSPNFVEKFEEELQTLQNYIKKAVLSHRIGNSIILTFELFGSFRNGFYSGDSDFDMTIFCKQLEREPKYSMSNILRIIQTYFQQLKDSNYINKIEHIARAKVPIIKLSLNNKILKNVDIVLNNAHGVENSKFLSNYSSNPSIKLLGIVIKKWAKCHDLIGPKQFSSYAIIYMMLYYLIKTEKLKPAAQIQLLKKKPQNNGEDRENQVRYKIKAKPNLQKKIDLYEDFVMFLQFYSQDGKFAQNQQLLCLLQQPNHSSKSESKQDENLKNCQLIHKTIQKQFHLINMHDPFDDSNPGRYGIDYSEKFYTTIDRSLEVLASKDPDKIIDLFTKTQSTQQTME